MFPDVIKNLDLEPMMVKAMDKEEGFGWTLEITQTIAEEYRKYLTLCLENPDAAIVPSSMVDDFWHLHILDTQKYAEDCQNVFGYFLHHFPYFGMRGTEDANNLRKAWNDSCKKYEQRFGKANETFWQNSARCPNCGRKCKNNANNEMRPRLAA
ncbi:glycine-rich domain-containing protein [Wielerella bovis]|uniref:glycine-rich domain-containing protein n=1 Tax=Wielerella bovis TaxID=2917790 RepID=UPI002019DF6F|nr:hypothetical protein [Wielerella bovis]ULJ60948.1 hypothetical protein MIS44_03590 [Wielerella bovis]